MRAVCFQCHFSSAEVPGPRCPRCDFPLIINYSPEGIDVAALASQKTAQRKAVALPGITRPRRASKPLSAIITPPPAVRAKAWKIALACAGTAGLLCALGWGVLS